MVPPVPQKIPLEEEPLFPFPAREAASARLTLLDGKRAPAPRLTPRQAILYWIVGFLGIAFSVLILSTAVSAGVLRIETADGYHEVTTVPMPAGEKVIPAVPLDELCRALDGTFSFNPASGEILFETGGNRWRFLLDSLLYSRIAPSGKITLGELDDPPLLKKGRLYLTGTSVKKFLGGRGVLLNPPPSLKKENVAGASRGAGSAEGKGRETEAKSEEPRSDGRKAGTPTAFPREVPKRKLAPFIRNIVIDAGHGDQDAGAIGPGGTLEKDVNLAVALKLARFLEQIAAGKVWLTRKDDRFLELSRRVAVAREKKADLFISIHSNSAGGATGRAASGMEVYFFSEPSDEAARLAEKLEGGAFSPESVGIDPILWNLMVTGNVVESHKLAKVVASVVPARVDVPNRGVKSARFYVLYYGVVSNIPSILVELGFISNPREERRLADPEWQERVAKALADAIGKYLKDLEQRYPNGEGWER
ncbi:MAG: hypothetical protein D6679_11605 [Candidatus Hydrogenedentota bacterium]|nr:MAG: hypothetical protein D6679_11605 [Candidatus Hydrogenedentota bacterium]